MFIAQTDNIYIYKKVELASLINKVTIQEKVDLDAELDRVDDDSRDENPYKELIVNNTIKREIALSQVEKWSTLSNVIKYVQYSKNPKDFHAVTVKPVNDKKLNLVLEDRDKDGISLRVDLSDILNGSKEEHLDRYEGVSH